MGQEQCGCISADERRGMAVRGRAAAQHCRARIPSAGECGAEKGNQFYESGDKEKVVFSLACVTCPIAWRMEMAKCAGLPGPRQAPKGGGSQGGPAGLAGDSAKAPLTSSGNVAFPPSVGAPLCGPTRACGRLRSSPSLRRRKDALRGCPRLSFLSPPCSLTSLTGLSCGLPLCVVRERRGCIRRCSSVVPLGRATGAPR